MTSNSFLIKVFGSEEVRKYLLSITPRAVSALEGWLARWANQILRDAKKNLVWNSGGNTGGRDTGLLKQSLTWRVEVENDHLEAIIGTNQPYAKFVEGPPFIASVPRRHFVPFSASPSLYKWARRHGIKGGVFTKGGKTRGLFVGGKVFPFLMPAYDANKSAALAAFRSLKIK